MVNQNDPWGWGRSLEWATSCPPPRHNFESLPRIRSESPAFDINHPEAASVEAQLAAPETSAISQSVKDAAKKDGV
jgi:cytochrome c oxidase subunit 1